VVVPPGVGKTHLAVALGIKACEQGVRTLFISATALITTLGRALAEGRLEERLKLLTQPQLLIVDEIGYLPIDRQGANLFFQLVSRRYERGSIILTSNQSLGAWGEVFGDPVIASTILDRLLHHSITVKHGRNAKPIFRAEIGLDAESAALYHRPERHFRGRRRAPLK
jgi:DNA replication protein DnaC